MRGSTETPPRLTAIAKSSPGQGIFIHPDMRTYGSAIGEKQEGRAGEPPTTATDRTNQRRLGTALAATAPVPLLPSHRAALARVSHFVPAPSSWMRNSVLSRRLASFSSALLMLSIESTSSMKITAGCAGDGRGGEASECLIPTHLGVAIARKSALECGRPEQTNVSVSGLAARTILPVPEAERARAEPRQHARPKVSRSQSHCRAV